MVDCAAMAHRVRELAARDWDVPAIEGRYRKLLAEGIARREPPLLALRTRKGEILDRVQRKAEEYEYLGHN